MAAFLRVRYGCWIVIDNTRQSLKQTKVDISFHMACCARFERHSNRLFIAEAYAHIS